MFLNLFLNPFVQSKGSLHSTFMVLEELHEWFYLWAFSTFMQENRRMMIVKNLEKEKVRRIWKAVLIHSDDCSNRTKVSIISTKFTWVCSLLKVALFQIMKDLSHCHHEYSLFYGNVCHLI